MDLYPGDNIELLKDLESNSVDSCVTDPPYGLSFMGKKWDYDVPSVEFWTELLRVLKPGAFVLSFGGTRTYHRMVVNMEDAGFEIRDQLQWIYGTGFPKSLDIGKKLKDWDGFGTALKPSNEPICLARKPLSEKTIVDNVLKWGVGGLNIDGCRIEGKIPVVPQPDFKTSAGITSCGLDANARNGEYSRSEGRWPANTLFDYAAASMLDEQSGVSKSGGASRFFYVAKASNRERNQGLEGLPKVKGGAMSGGEETRPGRPTNHPVRENHHPTVKPVKLMQYLVRLITPPNGICLDPFMGSGTTGIAAKNEGFKFIGMELNQEYFEIAQRRINDPN